MNKPALGFLLFLLSSSIVKAGDTAADLLESMDKLNHKILKTEQVLATTLSSHEQKEFEKLKFNLVEMKRLYPDFVKSDGMSEALKMASTAGWSNTIRVLNHIQSTCSDLQTRSNDCFMEISSFEEFVSTRAISETQKKVLSQHMGSYSKYIEARLALNDSFLAETSELLKTHDGKYAELEKPLVTVKIAAAAPVPETIAPVKAPAPVIVKPSSHYKWAFLAAGILTVLGVGFKRSSAKKRQIKGFYTHIFMLAKKKKLKVRLFGVVRKSNVSKVEKIHRPYMDLLNSAFSMNANAEVKIKNRDKKLVIETKLLVPKTIQEMMNTPQGEDFSVQLEETEKALASLGGELSIVNTFDSNGKMNATYFAVEV